MNGRRKTTLALALCLALLPELAAAQVADVLHFEGRLLSAGGQPAADGDYGVTLRFYASQTDTIDKALYGYSDTGVKVKNGLFSISVGAKGLKGHVDPKPFLQGEAAWVGIQVGSDPELPRLRLHKVPYAMRADVATSVQCTGCIGAEALATDTLKAFAKNADLAKVATTGDWADIKNQPSLPQMQQCAVGRVLSGFQKDGTPICVPDKVYTYTGKSFAVSHQSCPKGQVVRAIDAEGKVVCGPDRDTKTIYKNGAGLTLSKDTFAVDTKWGDARYVNEGQANSVTSAMVKNGQLTYADTNVDSIQRRVAASCPAGRAIRRINTDGKVVCETDVTAAQPRYGGSVVKGNWYRIASSKPGGAAATFSLYDKTGRSALTFRAGIALGDEGRMSFTLLSHSRASALVFEKVRLLDNGVSQGHYLDVKIGSNAAVYFLVRDNAHAQPWTPEKWTIKGTSDAVKGYASRIFEVDKLFAVGDSDDRFSIYRGGDAALAGSLRVAGIVRADKGVQVDGKRVIDDGASWHRSYGKSGWYNETYGGGVYMSDSSWVRVYGGKGFLIANALDVESTSSQIYLGPDGNGRVEIRSKKNGTPYIDFSNDTKADYDARLTLTGNDMLTVYGSRMTVNSGYGTITFGPANTGHAHIETDRSNFYFNKELRVDTGIIGSYNEDLQLRRAGSTGLTIRSGDVLLSRTLHANNHDINYVNQLHFHDNLRFIDEGNDSYLQLRWGDNGPGGIKLIDGNGKLKGYLYADGGASTHNIGLLDGDGNWAVHVSRDQYTRLLVNNSEKLRAYAGGVKITGNLSVTGSVTGKFEPSKCPWGLSGKGKLCYSGRIGGRAHRDAEYYCASTYGARICNAGEYEYISSGDGSMMWTLQHYDRAGTNPRFLAYRASSNVWYAYYQNIKLYFRCCRGR